MKRRKQRKQEELKEESEEEEEEVKEDPMSYIMPPLPGIGTDVCPIITQDDVPPEESTTSTLKTDEIKSTPSDLMAVDSTDNDAAAALHALAFLGKNVGDSGKSVEGDKSGDKGGVKTEEEGNAKSSPLDGVVSGDTTAAPPSLLLSSPARKSIVTSKSTPASVTPNAPVSKLDPPPSNPKLDNRNRSDSAALIASIVDDKPSLSDANLLMDLSPRPTSRPSSPPEKRTPQAMSEANLLMDLNKVG